jgi:hypothetical protein
MTPFWVAYLLAADIVLGPLPMRLKEVKQPVISTRNRFSRPRPRLLTASEHTERLSENISWHNSQFIR